VRRLVPAEQQRPRRALKGIDVNEEVTCPACGGNAWDAKGNACKTCKGNGTIDR